MFIQTFNLALADGFQYSSQVNAIPHHVPVLELKCLISLGQGDAVNLVGLNLDPANSRSIYNVHPLSTSASGSDTLGDCGGQNYHVCRTNSPMAARMCGARTGALCDPGSAHAALADLAKANPHLPSIFSIVCGCRKRMCAIVEGRWRNKEVKRSRVQECRSQEGNVARGAAQ